MKRLIIVAVAVATLSGCAVTPDEAAHYNNIQLVKCAVAGTSPDGNWGDSAGLCTTELEKRMKAHTITADEIAIGRSGGQATATQSAAESQGDNSLFGAGMIAGAINNR